MKKILLILTVLFSINTAFAQNDITFNICEIQSELKEGKKQGKYNSLTISKEKLLACLEININKKEYKISSFSFGIATEKDYIEINTLDNKINEKMINLIKEHKVDRVYIEKIIVENKSGEKSSAGFLTLHLK